MSVDPLPVDLTEIVRANVTCAAWLVNRGEVELAFAMRESFMAQWGFDTDHWNEECYVLIDYAERKGDGLGDDAYPFRTLIVDGGTTR
jgi:hypothetical protein